LSISPETLYTIMNETLSIDSNEEKPGKNRRIWIILAAVLGGLVLMCIGTFYLMRATGFLEITNQTGSMSIRDAYFTLDPEGPRPEYNGFPQFPSHADRIYLIVLVESPDPIPLGVRWYREGELLVERQSRVQDGIGWYIGPQSGEEFLPGMYRAEVFLIEDPVRTLEFRIYKSE